MVSPPNDSFTARSSSLHGYFYCLSFPTPTKYRHRPSPTLSFSVSLSHVHLGRTQSPSSITSTIKSWLLSAFLCLLIGYGVQAARPIFLRGIAPSVLHLPSSLLCLVISLFEHNLSCAPRRRNLLSSPPLPPSGKAFCLHQHRISSLLAILSTSILTQFVKSFIFPIAPNLSLSLQHPPLPFMHQVPRPP